MVIHGASLRGGQSLQGWDVELNFLELHSHIAVGKWECLTVHGIQDYPTRPHINLYTYVFVCDGECVCVCICVT